MASVEKAHDHGHRTRLRERFVKSGLGSFQDYEAVELLLTLAIPREDVKLPAKLAIKRFGSFRGVLDAPLEELRTIPGIGSVAPAALRIIREAANRYFQQKSRETFLLTNQEVLFDYCRSALGALPHEVSKVIYLDSGCRILGSETLEEGTIDRAAVYPRRVMDAAIRNRAAALVFTHNHPNGNVAPSEQDKTLTRTLVLAADTLQIEVVDHLIVSKDAVFSFRKEGLL
jgi:DNA repair protein RadC